MKGDLAHVYNRGVEKRKIFLDKQDYSRFVDNLLLLNNVKGKIRTRSKNIFNPSIRLASQKKLVDILKWTLLPNHYHLLLHEREEGGILEFTKRIGNAYTKYFNTRYKGRSGYLFQNSAKIVRIENNRQFLYIPVYIDLNSVDLLYSKWQDDSSINIDKCLEFLCHYSWSSWSDYCCNDLHVGLIDQKLFYKIFDTDFKNYKNELRGFLKEPIGVSTWQVDTVQKTHKKVL